MRAISCFKGSLAVSCSSGCYWQQEKRPFKRVKIENLLPFVDVEYERAKEEDNLHVVDLSDEITSVDVIIGVDMMTHNRQYAVSQQT